MFEKKKEISLFAVIVAIVIGLSIVVGVCCLVVCLNVVHEDPWYEFAKNLLCMCALTCILAAFTLVISRVSPDERPFGGKCRQTSRIKWYK